MATTTGPFTTVEREALIVEHLGKVRAIAHRIREHLPPHVTLEDLISVGIIGLIQAVDNFDPQLNVKFRTYAEYKIRGAILDSLRGMDWAPRLQRRKAKAIEAAVASAQQRLLRAPTEEEIAAELNIPLQTYWEWLADVQRLSLGSLEAAVSSSGSTVNLLEYIADDEQKQPLQILERNQLADLLTELIERLPPHEQTVLGLYYQDDLAPREIAHIMSIKAARVCQLRTQAVLRLRAHLDRRLSKKPGKA
ncbi:MAG: FliA/WhiG family RNA polymerase sigma factor [Bryobacterales bacterium]|nr:FliA/WhiG family RNA polymerase sigma factor [Bryobacterales bacterium]